MGSGIRMEAETLGRRSSPSAGVLTTVCGHLTRGEGGQLQGNVSFRSGHKGGLGSVK